MNPNYTHDFSSASIKHQIEAEFYQIVGKSLSNRVNSATIVTGPDYQRHVDNFRKYIGDGKLRICEIDPIIYTDIKRGLINEDPHKMFIENKSIELYGSTFIDCDLTCTSDLDVIKASLLKQIEVQVTSHYNKAFILSFGLRGGGAKPIESYLRPILGLLGCFIGRTIVKDSLYKPKQYECKWLNPVLIHGIKGRISDYKCYSYNAGGGPMLTCLLIYK